MYTPMLKNRVNGCHGNHAFFHSAIEFIFEDKNSLHFWGPNERFGTHEKLSWGGGCKVGQISSRGIRGLVVQVNHLRFFPVIYDLLDASVRKITCVTLARGQP